MPPKKKHRPGFLANISAPCPKGQPRFPSVSNIPHTPAVSGFKGFRIFSSVSQAPTAAVIPGVQSTSPSAPSVQDGYHGQTQGLYLSSPSAPFVQNSIHVNTQELYSSSSSAHAVQSDTLGIENAQPIQHSASSSSRPDARPRWDVPVVSHSKRGNRQVALSAATNDTSKQEAMRELINDVSAKSVGGTLDSMLNTWILFHKSWFGDEDDNGIPPFPLTTDKIWAVAAMFKRGKYRAFPNYCSVAKDHHISIYGDWPKALKRAVTKTTKSVLRGLGPARQSASIKLTDIKGLQLDDNPINVGGPINPGGVLECGGFWLPREVEVATARWKHATIDERNVTATWTLPASKTDVAAIGCARSWGCVCSGDRTKACGFHAMKHQKELVASRFSHCSTPRDELPLFPDSDGNTCTKQAMVVMIESVAQRLELAVTDDEGNRLFGGHSIRVLAAQHLASIGISLPVIMLLARWESAIIMRYVSEAPLAAVTQEYKNLQCQSDITQYIKGMREEVMQNLDFTASSDSSLINDLRDKCQELHKRMTTLETEKGRYIVNTDPASGKYHALLFDSPAAPPAEWRTRCGWRYGHASYTIVQTMTTNWKRICSTCLPLERQALQPDDNSDSDISSASESSHD